MAVISVAPGMAPSGSIHIESPGRAVISVEALIVPSAFGNSGLTKDSK